jgi:hypothetical protein
MPIIARHRKTEKTKQGIEVTYEITGVGDPEDPKGPMARRAKIRAAIKSGLVPDTAPQDIDSIRERYGIRASIVSSRVSNRHDLDPTEEEQEVFGPVANLTNTHEYTVLVSSRTSFGP